MTDQKTRTRQAKRQKAEAKERRLPRLPNGQPYIPGHNPSKNKIFGTDLGAWLRDLDGKLGDADLLRREAALLGRWTHALGLLAAHLPARTTARQAFAFLRIAEAHANGHSLTIGDLRETGQDAWGEPLIGTAIAKSYQLFLEPTKNDPEALGWVAQEPDENDRRLKHLRLTSGGIRIAAQVLGAMLSEREAEIDRDFADADKVPPQEFEG